jgi:hypothetical protein
MNRISFMQIILMAGLFAAGFQFGLVFSQFAQSKTDWFMFIPPGFCGIALSAVLYRSIRNPERFTRKKD